MGREVAAARAQSDESEGQTVAESESQLGLQLGSPLTVQLASTPHGARYQAHLLGMMRGTSILIYFVSHQVSRADFRLHDELTLRYLAGRSLHGFSTSVSRVCGSPFHYLHLAWPSQVERKEIRSSARVRTTLPAQLRGTKGSTSGTILDLSRTGASLSSKEDLGALHEKLDVALELDFEGTARTLQCNATIRSVGRQSRKSGEEGAYLYGIQFVELSEANALLLAAFVAEKLLAFSLG